MSPAWTGRRIVRPALAMPRWIAWRIHQVAYVENLKPLRQSNFSTAWMRPRLPSCTRSRSGMPDAWYASRSTRRDAGSTARTGAGRPRPRGRASGGLASPYGVRPLLTVSRVSRAALPGFDVLGEAGFVVLGQQLVPTDVFQIQANEVLVVPFCAVSYSCHSCLPRGLRVGRSGRSTAVLNQNDGGIVLVPEPAGEFNVLGTGPLLCPISGPASHRNRSSAPHKA